MNTQPTPARTAKRVLGNEYISSLCLELSLLLHSGITVADGLRLLIDDEEDASSAALLESLAADIDSGMPMSQAMERSQAFPAYVTHMALIGERAGRDEDTYAALSAYYESRSRLTSMIRSTLLYPSILLVLMLGIIGVLLVKVLPVFNQVFRQLGTEMTGLAGGLLSVGRWLSAALPVLGIVLALLIILGAAIAFSPALRQQLLSRWNKLRGDRGLAFQVAVARFASALALTMKSGLNMEESLQLATQLSADNPALRLRSENCLHLLDNGSSLSEALATSGVFPAIYCRMLALGVRSGTMDTVMDEIARRLEERLEERLNGLVSRIEPTLVIITSLLVGAIILSVMLPLMNIMSALG